MLLRQSVRVSAKTRKPELVTINKVHLDFHSLERHGFDAIPFMVQNVGDGEAGLSPMSVSMMTASQLIEPGPSPLGTEQFRIPSGAFLVNDCTEIEIPAQTLVKHNVRGQVAERARL